jgi:hypothetical protein
MLDVFPWPAERAQYDLFRAGWSFLIDIDGSPKRTSFTLLPFLARTADFFGPPDVRFGLLYPLNVSPL